MAFQVPTPDVSVVDLTCLISKPAKMEGVHRAMQDCGGGPDVGHPDPHHQRSGVERLAGFSFVLYH